MRPASFRLNARQLELLRRIAAGDRPVSSAEPELATTVYALRGRGLVETRTRRGDNGRWTASITTAGAYFAQHGRHPQDTAPRPATSRRARPEPLDVAVVVERVRANGGALTVARSEEFEASRWRSAVARSRHHPALQPGERLASYRAPDGGINVRLVAAPPPADPTDQAAPLVLRSDLRGAHPVITATKAALTRASPDHNGVLRTRAAETVDVAVTRALTRRALLLLHNLTLQAEQRGFALRTTTRRGLYAGEDVGAGFELHGQTITFKLTEPTRRTPHTPTAAERAKLDRGQPVHLQRYDYHPTGRLRLVFSRGSGTRDTFSDTARQPLEGQLPALLDELNARIEHAEAAQQAREEAAQQREHAYQLRLVDTRTKYIAQHRDDAILAQLPNWVLARDLRALAAAGTTAHHGVDDWAQWVRRLADRVDPLTAPPQLPADPEPTESELQRFDPALARLRGHW